jgi:hypothetical protein
MIIFRSGFLATALCAGVVVLSACARDSRAADITGCIAQAQQAAGAPDPQSGESAEERHDRIGDQVAVCMKALGYRHDSGAMAGERCQDDVDYNAYCYRRRD